MLNDRNPIQVQYAQRGQRVRPTPLVLIHDGGGTTFGYFTLGNLHRDVWAIHNPKYFNSEPWEGGMDEMAQHYLGLMKQVGIRGSIFLGGWSLGGYLALTMARMLASENAGMTGIRVMGLLLMDSPYLQPGCQLPKGTPPPDLEIPDLVQKCLDNCEVMLREWELPAWDEPAFRGKAVCFTVAKGTKSFIVPRNAIMYKLLQDQWQTVETATYEDKDNAEVGDQQQQIPPNGNLQNFRKAPTLPPAVMLRSVDLVPPKAGDKYNKELPCRVDVFRDETMLGWDRNHMSFIKAVMNTPSHHYDIFNSANTNLVTEQINEALEILATVKPVMA